MPRSLSLTAVTVTAALTLASAALAAVKLPDVTCAAGSTNARCQFRSSADRAGKTGTGLPLDLGGLVTIGSGFVDAAKNVVYVPVEFGSQQDNKGVIFRVDLATGNRTVVSGYEGEAWVGQGVEYVSDRGEKRTAYDLGAVLAVRPGPGGSLLALVDKGLQQRTEILKIDPATGNRTLVWASKAANDAEKVRPDAITQIEKNRFNFGSDALCRGGDKTALKPASTFETDGQNLYLFMVNNPAGTGTGLVKVPLTGGRCTWVSQYWMNGDNVVGSGPTINTMSPLVFGSALIGQEFVAATGPNPSGNALFAIHTQTGARRTISLKNVSTPARSVGSGDAQLGYLARLASGSSLIATARAGASDAYPDFVLVNPATGDRTRASVKVGSLSSGRDSDFNIVAAVPGTNRFIVAFGKALHVWDAATGNSYLLSQ